jgi:hypothetical protein
MQPLFSALFGSTLAPTQLAVVHSTTSMLCQLTAPSSASMHFDTLAQDVKAHLRQKEILIKPLGVQRGAERVSKTL